VRRSTRVVLPSTNGVPGTTVQRCTWTPSTLIPLAELRSTSSTVAPTSSRAWVLETTGSASTMSLALVRPITE
jgi:hypothetical protein